MEVCVCLSLDNWHQQAAIHVSSQCPHPCNASSPSLPPSIVQTGSGCEIKSAKMIPVISDIYSWDTVSLEGTVYQHITLRGAFHCEGPALVDV